MKIVVKQQGGFAGDQLIAQVDTQLLKQEKASQIEKAVASLNFSGSSSAGQPEVGADNQMCYAITIIDGDQQKTGLFFDNPDEQGIDGVMTKKLHSLLDLLQTS